MATRLHTFLLTSLLMASLTGKVFSMLSKKKDPHNIEILFEEILRTDDKYPITALKVSPCEKYIFFTTSKYLIAYDILDKRDIIMLNSGLCLSGIFFFEEYILVADYPPFLHVLNRHTGEFLKKLNLYKKNRENISKNIIAIIDDNESVTFENSTLKKAILYVNRILERIHIKIDDEDSFNKLKKLQGHKCLITGFLATPNNHYLVSWSECSHQSLGPKAYNYDRDSFALEIKIWKQDHTCIKTFYHETNGHDYNIDVSPNNIFISIRNKIFVYELPQEFNLFTKFNLNFDINFNHL